MMQTKPVIAVIACVREVEGEAASIVKRRYLDAVARYCDAIPVIAPAMGDADDAAALVARVDAVLLTGSNSNIEPSRYARDVAAAPPHDRHRDETAAGLIAAAMAANTPLFGVCRGLQEINVALGGTLIDERAAGRSGPSHHAPDGVDLAEMFAHGHDVTAEPGGVLEGVVGAGLRRVNSVHFQRVDRLAPGLRVEARSSDGVVEAVSSQDGASSLLAVQWHPEWQPEGRAHDMAFWRHVGAVARAAM
ncbi:gamma-glutamyl-gamma-aminobutyrate hydrolase family protein [Stappia sp. ES.058]|uniref:gamma-glutamyl-gamma-aminobutyrate hydrolase family protein n=1 Tax=Stappia sp. ES.058 TaxID=1881061 RepID=UPI00087A2316|nr:gamma-glutamyl-gamma-aminobutyrate hydrolase family protein [Stappia sp. ES.058]SDT90759.1 putative glutamine amidotransferase [Stappia sp. ES.058]